MFQGLVLNQEDGKKAGILNSGAPNPGLTLGLGVKVLTPRNETLGSLSGSGTPYQRVYIRVYLGAILGLYKGI